MGSLLNELGVIPLAAHLFIFYFGMMSMVTPPVALAGYASASIAEAPIMKTCLAAFRFSLVGFTLPFMFIYRPALLLMAPDGGNPTLFAVVHAVLAATTGIIALAAGLTGHLFGKVGLVGRGFLFLAAILLFAPIISGGLLSWFLDVDDWDWQGVVWEVAVDVTGAVTLAVVVFLNWWQFGRSKTAAKPI